MLTLNDGRNELWQWDTGRTLSVDADCSQVHFSNKVFGRSIDVDVVDGVAIIPDILLQTDKELNVWAFVGTAENGYTKIGKTFKVNRRNKPADYVFTPTDQTTLSELVERLDGIEESQDPNAIKNAVDEYLANNPIQVEEKDPTVPGWAKQPTKPKYTANEVGAVATVNGTAPDENGNVEIEIPEASEPDMTGYATERYVQENYQPKGNYLTKVPEGYAKTEDIPKKPEDIGAQPAGNYLTEVPSGYATEEFVKNKIAEAELSGEEVDLSGYAQKSELPTKVSELENDAGYLTEHQDLSDYAKKTELPVVPVQSVNGKTGSVKLSASDVGARPDNWIPTAQEVGALPSTYTPPNQTAEQVGADPKGTATTAVSQHNVSTDAHGDIRLELQAINNRLTAFFDSDDQTLDELSEIVAYITSNKSLIDAITTSKVSVSDIVNNLTTNVTNKPLSATQGVVLKSLIDTLSSSLSKYALASAIPTKVSQLTNDIGFMSEIPAGYATEQWVEEKIHAIAGDTETVLSDNLLDLSLLTRGKCFYYGSSGFQLVEAEYSYYGFIPLRGHGTYRTKFQASIHSSTAKRIALVDDNNVWVANVTGSHGDLPSDETRNWLDYEFVVTQAHIDAGATKVAFDAGVLYLDKTMMVKDREYPDRYIPFGYIEVSTDSGKKQDNVLCEKTAVFLGDSICAGTTVGTDSPYYAYGWGGIIGQANRMTWKNYGKNGGTITPLSSVDTARWVPTQADTAFAEHPDADYVIFEGGCNDADQMKDELLGEIAADYSTFDVTTFSGAFEALVLKLVTSFPTAKIGYIIPQKMYAQNDHTATGHVHRRFFDRAIEICEKWGIPYVDLWNSNPLNPTLSTASQFYTDGQHLTLAGYQRITPQIESWMRDMQSGGAGKDGKDGTSVTVKSVTESTEDGGSNVVEFSDGKTLTVKNGNKGVDGKTPEPGVDYWTTEDKQEIADYCRDEIVSTTVEVVNIKEKYGIDNTGTTDCSALINQAISEANSGSTLYLPTGTYLLDSTVNVNKGINLKFEGVMEYSGTEFAFFFTNYNHSKAEFNEIKSPNGSCIKLFADWTNNRHFIQYSHFIFQKLRARAKTDTDSGGCCIFAEPVNGGWINENRFTGGKIESGGYGVYADCYGENAFNGNLFDSCGIEGVGAGFYLANNCRNNMIFRCRHSESFEKFLHTVGVCYGLKVISAAPFNVSENVISNNTSGFVIATLPSADGTLCDTKANFVRGTIVCENCDNTKHLSQESDVFDMTDRLGYEEEYTNFVVGGNCTGLKLNKKYGYRGGINEFCVKFPNANTNTFDITDCDGNALAYNIPQSANSVVRFKWFEDSGWQYNYEFSKAEQVKDLIRLSNYVTHGEAVKTVNNVSPDENGNVEIVVVEEDPIVVGSIEECIDTTKKYVLPDGYIYAYRKRFYPGATTPNFTNQLPISQSPSMDGSVYEGVGYKYNKYLNNDYDAQVFTELDNPNSDFNVYTTGLIPIKIGDVVRVKRICCHANQGQTNALFKFIRKSLQYNAVFFTQNGKMDSMLDKGVSFTVQNNDNRYIYSDVVFPVNATTLDWVANAEIGWLVCCFEETTLPGDVIITVNEEITYTVTEDRYEWSWENTGEPYVKPDYLAMIADLQKQIDELKNA